MIKKGEENMVTIQDVAKKAGVSPATVSRVLNNNYTVSEKRRKLVLDAVKSLDYQPNLAGRLLRTSESRSLLVAFSALIPEFLRGVTVAANACHYDILFSYTPAFMNNPEPLKPLQQGLADGVILQDVMLDQEVLKEVAEVYPTVFCGGVMSFDQEDMRVIAIDNVDMAYQMTKHLLSKGKRDIGSVGILLDGLVEPKFSADREKGLQKALLEAGIELDYSLNFKGDVGYQTGRDAVEYYQERGEMPDAIFCFNDKIAIGCIARLKELGYRVPEDVHVAGFDNLGITQQYDPPISTIEQPFYEMGQEAVRSLIREITGEDSGEREEIRAKLILRRSTGD